MPFMGNKWDDSQMIPYRTALRAVQTRHPGLEPALPRPNDTARVWRVPGYAGSVGFISSMTQHFCSSCNRLRLTADGNLKVCLFGAAEVSLRDALRGGAGADELLTLVRRALSNKKPSHAGECPVPSLAATDQLLTLVRHALSNKKPSHAGECPVPSLAATDQLLTLVRRALSNKKPSHESRADGEPPDDSDRRLARAPSADVPSAGRLQRRAYSTRGRVGHVRLVDALHGVTRAGSGAGHQHVGLGGRVALGAGAVRLVDALHGHVQGHQHVGLGGRVVALGAGAVRLVDALHGVTRAGSGAGHQHVGLGGRVALGAGAVRLVDALHGVTRARSGAGHQYVGLGGRVVALGAGAVRLVDALHGVTRAGSGAGHQHVGLGGRVALGAGAVRLVDALH
ncbi:MoaC family, partial [Operophtera brumata]